MSGNWLIMPIDDWFFSPKSSSDSFLAGASQRIRLWIPTDPIIEPWQDKDDLSEDLRGFFQELYETDNVRQWCYRSKEWKSLIIDWKNLLLLPFATTAARFAAIFLKKLLDDRWQEKRKVSINKWMGIDPFTCSNQQVLIGEYASSLWEAWKNRKSNSLLNVTACPKELIGASILIGGLDGVPVYLWSELLQESLWLPGWELPFGKLKDLELELDEPTQKSYLRALLNGTPASEIKVNSFHSRWQPVLGKNASTASAIILREWFNMDDSAGVPREPVDLRRAK